MEKYKPGVARSTFEEMVNGVCRLLNSKAITSNNAFSMTAVYAMESLKRIEAGEIDPTASLAVEFLKKNWERIPEDIKLRSIPEENKGKKSQRKTK